MRRPTGGDPPPVKIDPARSDTGATVYIGRASFRMTAVDQVPEVDHPGAEDSQNAQYSRDSQEAQGVITPPPDAPVGPSDSADVNVKVIVNMDVDAEVPDLGPRLVEPPLPRLVARPLEGIRALDRVGSGIGSDSGSWDPSDLRGAKRRWPLVIGALAVALIAGAALAFSGRRPPRRSSRPVTLALAPVPRPASAPPPATTLPREVVPSPPTVVPSMANLPAGSPSPPPGRSRVVALTHQRGAKKAPKANAPKANATKAWPENRRGRAHRRPIVPRHAPRRLAGVP